MGDELTADLIRAEIRNHELEQSHERFDEARFAGLEQRVARLEADAHRHKEYEGDEEIEVEEIAE